MTLREGTVLDGRYRVEVPLDDWGVGECWRARDITDGTLVAVKLLPPIAPADRATAARLDALVHALISLRHKGIVATLARGVAQGRAYLVQSYLPGVSLARGLAHAQAGHHLIAPGVFANLIDRVCEALAFAHAASPAVVHGALVPGSIVAAVYAGRFEVRVIDFGLATVFGDRLRGARDAEFSAPEGGATALDDVYALGTILMDVITERAEGAGAGGTFGNLSAVAKRRRDMPEALMTVATRATRVNPRQRFPDAGALREALAAAWSPDARPVADAPAAPTGVAGVAAEADLAAFASWVAYADERAGGAPRAVTPQAPVVEAAPTVIEMPVVPAPVGDLDATFKQKPVRFAPPVEDLGATMRRPDPVAKPLAPPPVVYGMAPPPAASPAPVAPPPQRPRWLVPAAVVAALALLACVALVALRPG